MQAFLRTGNINIFKPISFVNHLKLILITFLIFFNLKLKLPFEPKQYLKKTDHIILSVF